MRKPEWRALYLSAVLTVVTHGLGYLFFQVLRNEKLRSWSSLWHHWDTYHYLFIAEHGYPAAGERAPVMVFFPLYPWLVRVVNGLLAHPLASALLVSSVCTAASAVLLYRLARLDRAEGDAFQSVVALLVFPVAYFLHAGYSESLFLMLTLGSFLQARRGRWASACVLAALSGMTRLVGLALLPAFLVEFVIQARRSRSEESGGVRNQVGWLAVVPLGFLVYLGLNAYVHGNPLQFLEFQRIHWHKEPGPIWRGLVNAWNLTWRAAPQDAVMSGGFELVAGLLGLAGGVAAWFRIRASYGAYVLATWAIVLGSSFWQSTPRYLLPLFPLFILASDLSREPVTRISFAFVSIALYAFFLSRFVVGAWAF